MRNLGRTPIWSRPTRPTATPAATTAPEGGSPGDTGVRRHSGATPAVLIVDDEEILAGAVRAYLVRRGYTVDVAGSGEHALARMRQSHLDLVILDYRLPDMDGLETLRRLKQLAPSPEVIMLSAHDGPEIAQGAIRLGAFEYLVKPIDLVRLHAVLDEAWARARSREAKPAQDAAVA
jgi:DNA-binding response OmpR family regulator